jgi:hypothetical protein
MAAKLILLDAEREGLKIICDSVAGAVVSNLLNPRRELGHLFEWLSFRFKGTKKTMVIFVERCCLVLPSGRWLG